MPQIKANMKTMRTDAKKRAAHAAVRSQIRGAMKKAVAAANSEEKDAAFRNAQSVIDAAARKKSRLNASVNAAIAAEKALEAKEAAEEAREEAKEAYKEALEEQK